MNRDWIFDRCREVQADPNGRLDLWAREHYKSTIITFGLTLQDILSSHGEDPDPKWQGIEVTFGFFSHSRPIAKQFLKQIKREVETNEELRRTFPDVLWQEPKREAPTWSEDDGLIFRRRSNPKEATVEAWGLVDGQPTSKHFFIRVYDDVVVKASVTNPEMILKTTTSWEESTNLGMVGGHERYAGTRWHLFDSYVEIEKRGAARVRKHPATRDGSDDIRKSVFMPVPVLAKKRRDMGPYTFGAQMLLDPIADKSQGFRAEWLRYWPRQDFANLNTFLIVDPASGRRSTGRGKVKSDNDFTTMWVIGVGADGKRYVCDLVRDRLNLTGRAKWLFTLHRKWKPLKVGYEHNGMQADIEHIKTVQGRLNYRFDIVELKTTIAKQDRIKKLIPLFEQGDIYLPEGGIIRTNWEGRAVDVIKEFIEEEYLAFPVCSHDDGLDGLARIEDPDMGITPFEVAPKDSPGWRDDLEGETADWQTM